MENTVEEKKDHSTQIFVSRAIGFALFGCILPFVFIAWRYDIFKTGGTDARVSLTGWGFIAILIVFFFIKYCLDLLKQAIPFSMTYQILSGFIKVIMPLILLYVLVNALENSINLFKQALIVTIICEAIAIVINPFPKYMHDKGIERTNNLFDTFIQKWKEKE